MKPETKFRKSKVDPFLKSLPNCYFDAIQQMAKVGSPDYYLCVSGHFVALECKSEDGKTTPLQDFKLGQVSRAGGTALVASPHNWEQVKQVLTKLSKGEAT